MVGSSIGWTETPYVACPAQPDEIFDACVELRAERIHIVPGLSCHNRFNAPDYLRGEETQILGAASLVDSLQQGRRVVCLPGTHTKWAVLENGWVRDFFTAPTGELFALLRDHSILVRDRQGTDDGEAFRLGLAHCNEFPHQQVLHRLFECRSRQLSGEIQAPFASAYLSGLLIAADVNGALRALADDIAAHPLVLIGSPQLTQLYASALTARGSASQTVDGVAASLAGLRQVYRHVSEPVADEH
jgi:2-dehydro-3-deoxygalactonokinase